MGGASASGSIGQGLEWTGSVRSAGKGWIVAGVIPTLPFTCSKMGGLVTPTPSGWWPGVSALDGAGRRGGGSGSGGVGATLLVGGAATLVLSSTPCVDRGMIFISPTITASVLPSVLLGRRCWRVRIRGRRGRGGNTTAAEPTCRTGRVRVSNRGQQEGGGVLVTIDVGKKGHIVVWTRTEGGGNHSTCVYGSPYCRSRKETTPCRGFSH